MHSSLCKFFSYYETQQLILGTGTAIWWVTEPHCQVNIFGLLFTILENDFFLKINIKKIKLNLTNFKTFLDQIKFDQFKLIQKRKNVLIKICFLIFFNKLPWRKFYLTMRLCHPPDGSTSPKYKLLCFIITKKFAKRRMY